MQPGGFRGDVGIESRHGGTGGREPLHRHGDGPAHGRRWGQRTGVVPPRHSQALDLGGGSRRRPTQPPHSRGGIVDRPRKQPCA